MNVYTRLLGTLALLLACAACTGSLEGDNGISMTDSELRSFVASSSSSSSSSSYLPPGATRPTTRSTSRSTGGGGTITNTSFTPRASACARTGVVDGASVGASCIGFGGPQVCSCTVDNVSVGRCIESDAGCSLSGCCADLY